MNRTLTLALAALACSCGSVDEKPDGSCPAGEVCDSGTPAGPVHGLRSDGTVDITPAEAWPNRGPEPPPLSADELARACVALAACIDVDPPDQGTIEDTRRLLLHICIKPEQSYTWEERAVPTLGKNERWTWEARSILAEGGDCAAVAGASSERAPEIYCEEAGCWWKSTDTPIPEVSCQGDVATLTTKNGVTTRDCSRAFATCDSASPTGCTDRAPVACEHPAADRCDGDIRLGCDGSGRVSFHDCARAAGGSCENDDCVYPAESACPPGPYGCNGDVLRICVLGEALDLDCNALGFAGCTAGFCAAP